ncbi:MAG TPA: ATP-binding protein [Candidatus Methylacidiphilales bacterium]|nr:ATP-binding protein [Candidatus Methylacidiphilales bacterium]
MNLEPPLLTASPEGFLLRSLLQNIPDHIYFKDQESRFIMINPAAARHFKMASPEEAVGKTDFDMFTYEHASAAFADEQKVMKTGEPIVGLEEKETRPDGAVFWVTTTKLPLRNAKGEIVGTFGISRDITKQVEAREQLKIMAARLARSNQELQDFAYIASHDLQEPLRKVRAFGERLRSKCLNILDEEALDYLSRMQNAAIRMQALINGLLTYSQVSTKAKPYEMVDLNAVAREVVEDLSARLETSKGRVQVGEMPSLEADPLQMRQLLQNLIGNGLKFHAPDKPPMVRVFAEKVEIHHGILSSQPHWRLVVEDEGVGFDQKYAAKLFAPFERLHHRSEFEGTGMGLAVCRKIVERHGGMIEAHSILGKGARFEVTLPSQFAGQNNTKINGYKD